MNQRIVNSIYLCMFDKPLKTTTMKRAIKTWILKNYPPIVLTILIMMTFVAMCALLSVIEYLTTDLPIQYQ